MIATRRARLVWWAVLAATSGLLLLAVLPPFLPKASGIQAIVRESFAPVCHQMPSRSPHLYGVPLAVCDRCLGIYLGFVVGVAGTGWGRSVWRAIGSPGRYVLLGSLVPLGVDWVGPFLGLWANTPVSRALTGGVFGLVAASYVTDRLLRKVARTGPSEDPVGRSGFRE